MAKKAKAAPRAKAKKESVSSSGDPEWEDLQERFNTLSSDFRQLAEMAEQKEEAE
jgi:hypothetical protein